MEKLKKLEINKLIRELEYFESDYEYKSEMLHTADVEFLNSVNKIVESSPELKEIYNHRINQIHKQRIENISHQTQETNLDETEKDQEIITSEKDPKLKSIYRNIVKKTHPDKVGDEELKNFYIESTKFYETDDIVSLYKICDKLQIEYDIEDNDYYLIQNQIQKIKEKVQFLESTFTWMWLNAEESKKEEIILNFVRIQII
jgi:hypothetical protein